MGKAKQQDNPFIEPSQQHAVVDMKGKLFVWYWWRRLFIEMIFDIFLLQTWWCWTISLNRRRDVRAELRSKEVMSNVQLTFAHVTFFSLTVFYHPLSQMCISCVMSILSFWCTPLLKLSVQFSPLIFSAEDFCLSALYIVDRFLYIQSISLSLYLSLFFFYCLISKSRLIENYFHIYLLVIIPWYVLQCMVRFLLVPISFIFIIITL